MLEVHAPHERMEGFRDFLLHLLTITVGLLIALGLEGCVQLWHDRNLRVKADATIQQEIRDNGKEMKILRAYIAKEKATLVKAMDFLEARQQGAKYDVTGMQLGFSIGTLADASWRTAASTGALSHMEYGRVQTYAALYKLQDKFDRLQDQTFADFQDMQSYVVHGFNPETFPAAKAAEAEIDVRHALAHLSVMDDIGAALTKHYDEALRGR